MMTTIEILGRKNIITYGERSPADVGMGRANSGEDKIWIWNGLSHDGKRETLLHEILHQISEYADLDLTEQQVSILGIALNLLKMNPQETIIPESISTEGVSDET